MAQVGAVVRAGAGVVVEPVLEVEPVPGEGPGATRIGPGWPRFARRWDLGPVGL